MLEKVKYYWEEHKVLCTIAATTVVTAGITFTIMRGRYAGIPGSTETSVFVRPLSIFSNRQTTTTIVNVIEREGRGHPGYMTRCIETGQEWVSQTLAAKDNGVSDLIMSMHIRGKLSDVNGLHFEHVLAA